MPIMNKKILLLNLLFFGVFTLRLQAQGLFACPGLSNASSTCAQSCINCNLDGLTGLNNIPLPPGAPNSLCHDDIILENPRFFGFIAGSTNLNMAVFPTNCQTGQGLEGAFIDNCTTTIGCLPGPNPLNGFGAFVMSATNLVVGRPYQLVIDGYNGDVCNFSFLVMNGSTQGPPLGPIDSIEGLDHVCPNATTTYSIPPVNNAVSYTWSAPAGSSINGGNSVRILPATGNNTVQIAFGNAGGNVCVTASNACSPQVTTCFQISNVPLPIHQLADEIVCYGQIPYEWAEEPHTILAAPGTYNLTSSIYDSYLGCDSIVKQKLTVLPLNQVNLPLRYLCKNECFTINGIEYCETGTFQEFLYTDNGCDSIVNFSLRVIPSKAVVAQPDTITCAVTSVPLSGVGSTTGNTVSYRWLDPTGQTISNAITATATQPGLFALIVTNTIGGNACMDTALVNVPGNLTPPLANAGPDKVLTCIVTQVQLQGVGSVGADFTYFWKAQLGGNIVSGVTTLNPIVNAPGAYTLRVTNNHNGCTAISNAVVTAQIAPPVVTAAGGDFTCSMPHVDLQVSTNAADPGFSWTGPNNFESTLQSPTVNVPGTYAVVVTNGVTGCTASATAQVNAGNDTPDLAVTGGGITCVEDQVVLGATSSVPGMTYQWSGPNGFSSGLQNPLAFVVGNYEVVATAPNGCTNTAIAIVSLNNTPPGTSLASSGSLNCVNETVNVLATSMGNPANLIHTWTLPDGSEQNSGSSAFLPATAPGTYSVLVNNTATGCSSNAAFTVVEYADVSVSIDKYDAPRCFGSNDGSLSALPAGGNGNYTFLWSNGATTNVIVDLGQGNYDVTVSDGENCSATLSLLVLEPAPVNTNATSTAQSAIGVSDGTAAAIPTGGTLPYTFVWSTGETTAEIVALSPGSYTVTVTDDKGCTAEKTVNVSQFDCTLQTLVLPQNITCFGADNGSATLQFLSGESPFTILWSTGDTLPSVNDLSIGQYSVSITDANNCPEVQSFSIQEPAILMANASGSTTSGLGTNDGTASANPIGGSGTYFYTWSNGEETDVISGLAAGTYTVIVQDDQGCLSEQSVEVLPGNCNLITDFQNANPTCYGYNNGSSTILLTGGSGGFSYAWSNGGTSATVSGLTAGTHTVSITDQNGCSISVSTSLSDPAALSLTVESNVSTTCPNAPEGSVTVSVAGGSGALFVGWSNGQAGYVATFLTAGVYTAVVTDEFGCTAATSVEILSNDTEAPVIIASNTNVAIGPDGTVVLTVQNTNMSVTDNCALASVVFQPTEFQCTQLGNHLVTVTATDAAGHVVSQSLTVTVVDNSAPILICSPSLVVCFEDNPVSYQAPNATDNCLINGGVFNITQGLPIGAVFPLGSTTTTYSFTDAQGNTGTCSFEVTVLSPQTIVVDTVINDINFQQVGGIFIQVGGGLPPYTYAWILNGQTVSNQQNITGIAAGDYTVIVTDDNGCIAGSQSIVVSNTSATSTPVAMDGIRVFPNPTADNLSVLLPDAMVDQSVFLQLLDQTGRRVVDQVSLREKQIDLTFPGLSNGLYFLVVRVGGNQMVRKVVLNRP
jgi:hypothetical protein